MLEHLKRAQELDASAKWNAVFKPIDEVLTIGAILAPLSAVSLSLKAGWTAAGKAVVSTAVTAAQKGAETAAKKSLVQKITGSAARLASRDFRAATGKELGEQLGQRYGTKFLVSAAATNAVMQLIVYGQTGKWLSLEDMAKNAFLVSGVGWSSKFLKKLVPPKIKSWLGSYEEKFSTLHPIKRTVYGVGLTIPVTSGAYALGESVIDPILQFTVVG